MLVVGTMFFDNAKLLIDKPRKRKTYQMIGGRVEEGETPLIAAIRECKEELDVDITVGKLFMKVVHEYPDITIGLSLFEADIDEGQEIKLLEHVDAKWITAEEIDEYEFCPADEDILAKIKSEYRRCI